MRNFLKYFSATTLGFLLGAPMVVLAAAYLVVQGGTGQTSFNQGLLYSPGGSTALVATSSGLTIDHVFATSTTATSTFAAGVSMTRWATISTSTSGGIKLNSGCFQLADGTCLSASSGGTVSNIATTFPILGGPITTTGTLTFGGLSTTTPWTQGQLVAVSGSNANQVSSVATTSVGCSGNILCTGFTALGSASTITFTGILPIANGGTATSTGGNTNGVEYFDGSTLTNSGLFKFNGSNVSIGATTTFGTLLNLHNVANFGTATSSIYGTGLNLASGCYAIAGTCIGQAPVVTNYWTLNSDKLYNNSGTYVGIGTTTPSAFLDVTSNSSASVASSSSYSVPGTYTVSKPTGATTLTVKMWGGGGAGGSASSGGTRKANGGGAGSYVTFTTSNLASSYTLKVAQGAQSGTGGTGHASGGNGANSGNQQGGGGGGSSSVASTTGTVIACGGGGGAGTDGGAGAYGRGATGSSGGVGGTGNAGNGTGGGGGGACASGGGNASNATAGAAATDGSPTSGTNGDGALGSIGGGGSSAGTSGNGNTATTDTGATGSGGASAGAAGATGESGGGGTGKSGNDVAGAAAGSPGGGGGGVSGAESGGGNGGNGRIELTWTANNTKLVNVGNATSTLFTITPASVTSYISLIVSEIINTVTYVIFQIDVAGHEFFGGPTPAVTSCGTGSPAIVGNDNAMRVTTGTNASTCTVTFANPWGNNAPICVANEESAGSIVASASSTPTSLLLTFASALTIKQVAVICRGYQ